MSMFREILEKLQSAPEHQRRIWLVVFSLAAMVVVVFLWFGYFNALVVSSSKTAINPAPEQELKKDFSFLGTMKTGAATVYEFFKEKAADWFGFLSAPKEYFIKP